MNFVCLFGINSSISLRNSKIHRKKYNIIAFNNIDNQVFLEFKEM